MAPAGRAGPPSRGDVVGSPRAPWDVLLVVAAGGGLGSLTRWALSVALPHGGRQFPWSTFTVNVVGCLLIGALMRLEDTRWQPHRYRRPFLQAGVLGGFTTFSAYGADAQALAQAGAWLLAIGYLAGTLVLGLLAVRVGDLAAAGAVAALRRGNGRRDGVTA